MPRTRTPETFDERKERGLRAASVSVVSADMEFEAQMSDQKRSETGPLADDPSGGTVTHTGAAMVTMYKPTPQGYVARHGVPASSIAVNLRNGWRSFCPHCGGQHGSAPNECPGKDQVAYRTCPVCPGAHKVFDNRVNYADPEAVDTDDPNLIQDAAYAATTPAIRTKAALDLHMWARHPQEAREMGLPPLPESAFAPAQPGAGPQTSPMVTDVAAQQQPVMEP